MKFLTTYITFVFILSLVACKGQQSSKVDVQEEEITKIELRSEPISVVDGLNLDEVMLIDVRTPEEFNAGHIDQALNINFYDENFVELIKGLNTEKTLYLYCRSGKRSMNATKALTSMGMNVVNLEGGFNAYSTTKH